MDLEGMSEAQMDLLMEQIAHAKKQKKARRTPEPPSVPQPSPEPVPRDQTPPPLPQNSNDIRKGFTRSKHRRDSESEDLEALDNFFKEFVTSDLPDEEWLYVSPVFRHTELHKKMRVADWLRIGSEDEFDEMPDFNPARRNEYRRSPSPSPASAVSLTRYRSPPQQTAHAPGSPRGSSPLSVDILKITTTRSRYVEEMERRKSLPSPTPITPSPDPPGDPSEPSPAHSPQNDWTRMGANSPKTPLERTNSPRQTFQTNLFQQNLPYWPLLHAQVCEHFAVLKRALSHAVQFDASHTCQRVFAELLQFIRRYRRHFSKRDHVALIRICYHVGCYDVLPGYALYACLGTLFELLSPHKLLSPSDLQLGWRPLFELYLRVKKESLLMRQPAYWDLLDPIIQLVSVASFYFPPEATREILMELYPQLHPSLASNTYTHVLTLLTSFLPINGGPDTWGLWFHDVTRLWLNSGPILSRGDAKVLKLLSRLAPYTVGRADWAPYLHQLFDQLLKSVNIPVGPHKLRSRTLLPPKLFSKLIVYSIHPSSQTLSHLSQLMASLETFFHPSNDGRHLKNLLSLLSSLVSDFSFRCAVEAGTKAVPASLRIPAEFQLRDEDIDRFVTALLPALRLALFAKEEKNQLQVATALGGLSALRPRFFVLEMIEEAKEALVSVTEPHRLTSLLACLYTVSASLTTGQPGFPEGRAHVVPLLMAILPGLDVNDTFKTALSLKVLTQLVSGVPLVDCSGRGGEGEGEIGGQTRLLEEFLLEFIAKMFHFLECATTFMTLGELEGMQTGPHIHTVEAGMSLQSNIVMLFPFSLSVLLSSCPLPLFRTAVQKIFQLTTGMCGSIDKPGTSPYPVIISHVTTCRHGELAARLFFAHCLQCVRRVAEECQLEREERGDPEVKWNLELLSAVLQYGGGHALSHLQEVRDVLRLTRYARCKEIYQMAAGLLYDVITCLCGTYLTPKHHMGLDLDADPGTHDFLADWGTYFSKKEIQADWHLPSPEEVSGAESLLTEFLLPELDKVRRFVEGGLSLGKDEIQNSLTLIDSALQAAAIRFEETEESPLPEYDQLLPPDLSYLRVRPVSCHKPTLRFGGLKMGELCPLMHALAGKLFLERQHETESMDSMVSILHSLLWPPPTPSGWSHVKIFEKVKQLLSVRVRHKSRYAQCYLLHRLEAAHDSVGWEEHPYLLTPGQELLMRDLLDLATSEYAATRQFAQLQLDHCFSRFLLSRRLLFPRLLALLAPDTPRERLKGALHTMLFNKNMLLEYVCRNPALLSCLLPALLSAPHTDKQPVIDLLSSVFAAIRQYVGLSDPSPPPFSPRSKALVLDSLGEELSPEQLGAAREIRGREQREDLEAYLKFVTDLIAFVQRPSSSLFFEFSLSILSAVPHPSLPRPPSLVPALLPVLTHDTASVRYTAIRMLERIIKFKRRPFKKVRLCDVTTALSHLNIKQQPGDGEVRLEFGESEENEWLCVLSSDLAPEHLSSQKEWDDVTFVDKSVGFTRPCASDVEVFAPAKNQLLPSSWDQEDQLVISWFSEAGNAAALVAFLSQEERKNAEEFRLPVEDLFKGLSKSYGPRPLSHFSSQLHRLMTSPLETEQRLGLELAAGMLLGANHWEWQDVSRLEAVVAPAFFQGIPLISKETSPNWATFVSRLLFKRDPRRFLWLWRGLLDQLFNPADSCHTSAMRLLLLDCALFYGSWRVSGVKAALLPLLTPHLASPFQMLRSRIARLLVTVFSEEGPLTPVLRSPSRHAFLAQLDAFPSTSAVKLSAVPPPVREKLVCGIKVLAEFLSRTAKLVRFSPELLSLGETVLAQRNAVEEEELNGLLDSLAHSLSLLQIPRDAVPSLLTLFSRTRSEENWQLKLGKLYLFQVLTFLNLFTVLSHEQLVAPAVRSVLTSLLSDERIEVRDQAAESLSGLVRCGFYRAEEVRSLVAEFSEQLGVPPQGRRARGLLESSLLLRKHAGLLGLGAVVLAFPYSVPPFLPDIVMLVGNFLQAPPPLQASAKHVLSEFKRTHWDQWDSHRLAFSDAQLTDLRGMLVSPTYYV